MIPVPINEPYAYQSIALTWQMLDAAYSRMSILDNTLDTLRETLVDDPQIYLDADANNADMVLIMTLIQPLRIPEVREAPE